ncbi:uncharacterized protein KGF55_005664 [Candida pseudojiufengensis]|uniref:uncharacterized protein n=1 Tax=Candida pseudojiufengensis TaxID=497109 RepID=UPI002224BC96|nr:uncharacterized protein KGF55_005664 [Candida pseudojiufengensis]KAI5959010.1 hypothetical protein KGF55_005664 [Candida pseudojiufengensis]
MGKNKKKSNNNGHNLNNKIKESKENGETNNEKEEVELTNSIQETQSAIDSLHIASEDEKNSLRTEEESSSEKNGTTIQSNNNGSETSVLSQKLKEVEEERDKIQSAYDSLYSKLSGTKAYFQKMKDNEEILEQSVEELTNENEKLKNENTQLNDTVKDLKEKFHEQINPSEVQTLKEQNIDLNNECEKLSDALTRTRREYTTTIEELQDEKYNIENRNSKLTKNIHELKQEITDLTIIQGELQLERKNLTNDINEYKEKLDFKEKELEKCKTTIDELNEKIKIKESAIQEEVSNFKSQIDILTTTIEENNNIRNNLQNELETYKVKQTELEEEVKKISEYKTEINNKQLLIGKLRHEAIILNEHLTKALTMLKQGGDGSNKSVDRELISNVIISFLQFPRGDSKKFEALQLISALLEWDQSQKIAAGLQHLPNQKGLNGPIKYDSEGNEIPQRQSFVSLWTEYLEKESLKK